MVETQTGVIGPNELNASERHRPLLRTTVTSDNAIYVAAGKRGKFCIIAYIVSKTSFLITEFMKPVELGYKFKKRNGEETNFVMSGSAITE